MTSTPQPLAKRVLTIGHSTRAIDDFIALLRANDVKHLIDVRTICRSRHNPQFNADKLAASLGQAGIAYTHMASLGGLRHAKRDSANAAWRNESFRGYADYMQTPEFAQAIAQLIAVAQRNQVVIMCAEAVPWRCHRSLIADALLARGIPVADIIGAARPQIHRLTPFAKVNGEQVTYPGPAPLPQAASG